MLTVQRRYPSDMSDVEWERVWRKISPGPLIGAETAGKPHAKPCQQCGPPSSAFHTIGPARLGHGGLSQRKSHRRRRRSEWDRLGMRRRKRRNCPAAGQGQLPLANHCNGRPPTIRYCLHRSPEYIFWPAKPSAIPSPPRHNFFVRRRRTAGHRISPAVANVHSGHHVFIPLRPLMGIPLT